MTGKKRNDKESGSSHSRSNNTVVEADVTAPHRNGSQLHSQGHVITSHGHQHTRTVVQTVDGDESSSSSTSTTSSSDSDSADPQMAMVSRPPFHPSMMGLQPHHMYHNPMAMQPMGFGPCGHPGMMGSIDYPPGFGAFGGRQFGGGPIPYGGVSGGGVGPPRCFPYDDEALDERVHARKNPMIMEHPSLRQFVIFMAILFLLALVALIVTAIYFGRTLDTNWRY